MNDYDNIRNEKVDEITKNNGNNNANCLKVNKVNNIKIIKIDPIKIKPNLLDKFKLTGIQDQLKAALSKQIANNELPESIKSVVNESKSKSRKSISVKEPLIESKILQKPQSTHLEINANELGKSNNLIAGDRQQNTKKILSDFLLRKKNKQNIVNTSPVLNENSEKIIPTNLAIIQPPSMHRKRMPQVPILNPKKKKITTESFLHPEKEQPKLLPVSYPAIQITERTISKPISTTVRKLNFSEDTANVVPKTEVVTSNQSEKIFEVTNELGKETLQPNLDKSGIAPKRKIENIQKDIDQGQPPISINIEIHKNSNELEVIDNSIEKPMLEKSKEHSESTSQISRDIDYATTASLSLPSFNKVFILANDKNGAESATKTGKNDFIPFALKNVQVNSHETFSNFSELTKQQTESISQNEEHVSEKKIIIAQSKTSNCSLEKDEAFHNPTIRLETNLFSDFICTQNNLENICKDQNINDAPIVEKVKDLDNIEENAFKSNSMKSKNEVDNKNFSSCFNIPSSSLKKNTENAVDFLASVYDTENLNDNDEDVISLNSDDTSNGLESFEDFMTQLARIKKEPKSEPMSPKSKFTILENKILSEDEQYDIYNIKDIPTLEILQNTSTSGKPAYVKNTPSISNLCLEPMPPIVMVPSTEQIKNNEVISFGENEYIITEVTTQFQESSLSNFTSISDERRFNNLDNDNNPNRMECAEGVESELCFSVIDSNMQNEPANDPENIDSNLIEGTKENSQRRRSRVFSTSKNIEVQASQSLEINAEHKSNKKSDHSVQESKSSSDEAPEQEEILITNKEIGCHRADKTLDVEENVVKKSKDHQKTKKIERNAIQKKDNKKKEIKIPIKLKKSIFRGLKSSSTPVSNKFLCEDSSLIEQYEQNCSQEITEKLQYSEENEIDVSFPELLEPKEQLNKSPIIEVSVINSSETNSIDDNEDNNNNTEDASIHSIDDSYENDEPFLGFNEELIEEFSEKDYETRIVQTSDHTYTSENFENNSIMNSLRGSNNNIFQSSKIEQKPASIIPEDQSDPHSKSASSNVVLDNLSIHPRAKKNSNTEANLMNEEIRTDSESNIKFVDKESSADNNSTTDSRIMRKDSSDTNSCIERRKPKKKYRRIISSDDDENVSTKSNSILENSDVPKYVSKVSKKNSNLKINHKSPERKISEDSKMNLEIMSKKVLHPNLLLIRDRSELDQNLIECDPNKKPKKTEFQCGMCKAIVYKKSWNQHLYSHYGIGWKEGEEPLDLTSRTVVLNKLVNYFKARDSKPLVCRLCREQYKSGLGMLDHLAMCGLTVEETRVKCEHCEKYISQTIVSGHLKKCPNLLKKLQQIETDRIEAEAKAVEEVLKNSGRSKRKSKIKAENKMKSFVDEPEFDPNDYIKTMIRLSGGIYKKYKSKLDTGESVKCPGCNKELNKYDILKSHIKNCNKIKFSDYQCKLCNKIFPYQKFDDARKHVIDTHNTASTSKEKLKNNFSDSECEVNLEDEVESEDDSSFGVDENEISSGPEEEEENNYSDIDSDEQNSKKQKKGFKTIVPSGSVSKHLNLIGSGKSLFFDLVKITHQWMRNFQLHHYFEENLFSYAVPDYKSIQSDFSLESHLPENKISLKFSFSKQPINSKVGTSKPTKPWMQIKQFDSLISNNEIFLYIGGPITTLNWIPIQQKQKTQYLAITYKKNFNQYIRRINPKSSKSLILIHKVINSKTFKKSNDENSGSENVHYGIVNYTSPINDIAFLPSGGYNENLNRLGLMAVADNKSSVNIYSLPIEAPKNCDNYNEINIMQLNCKIQLKLAFFEDDSENDCNEKLFDNYTNVQCTKVVWSKSKNHNYLITGYSNGFIAIWDINKENTLSNMVINDVQISTPLNYFMVTDKTIIGLDMHYDESNSPRWLVATSVSRTIKVYDIENFMQPICIMEEMARSFPTDCTWPITWENPCVSITNDLYQSSIIAYNPLGIFHKIHRYSRSWDSIKTIDFNPWINLMAVGCDNGDVFIEVNGEMNQDVSLKRYFDKKFFSYTDLISLDGSAIPIIKEEGPKSNKKTEKKSKDSKDHLIQNGIKLFDDDYENKYGIIFGELNYKNFDRKINVVDDRIPAFFLNCFVRINAISWNENEYSNNLCAMGYENGFIRIINFDVMRFKHEGKIL